MPDRAFCLNSTPKFTEQSHQIRTFPLKDPSKFFCILPKVVRVYRCRQLDQTGIGDKALQMLKMLPDNWGLCPH